MMRQALQEQLSAPRLRDCDHHGSCDRGDVRARSAVLRRDVLLSMQRAQAARRVHLGAGRRANGSARSAMESAVTVLSGAQIGALLADIEQMPLDADPRAWPDAALRAAVAIRQLRAEIYEAHAFLTGKGEMAYIMTHPRDEPDTELGDRKSVV